jgi:hypothetical protein
MNDKKIVSEILTLIKRKKYDETVTLLGSLIEKQENIHEKYSNWFKNRSKEEKELHYKAIQYEGKYFSDMTLEKYSSKLTSHEVEGKVYQDGLDTIFNIEINQWIFRIKDDLEGCHAQCDLGRKQIDIQKKYKNDKPTILHEMIHAYESMIPEHYRQYLVAMLYRKLSRKVDNLHRKLSTDSHIYLKVHTPLFLLKSFDLDLRLKKPLGTVYAYGRKELLR